MGYRIDYDRGTKQYEVTKRHPFRFPVMLALCFVLFIAMTHTFWPEGVEYLREIMIPGDNTVTLSALNHMTVELQAGTPVKDAVMTFCQEIMNGAKSMH